jgi:hypothetical protein
MRIPEKTAHEPFFVARRLRRVTMASVRRSDELSHAYIAQAADLISEQAKKIAKLSLVVANYERERPIGERRNSPHGKIVRGKTTAELAKRLRGEITGLCDLYRAPNGAVRIVRPDAVASGELVGRFDGTATWQQIAEALE